jgi:hypothetical protein
MLGAAPALAGNIYMQCNRRFDQRQQIIARAPSGRRRLEAPFPATGTPPSHCANLAAWYIIKVS